MWSPGDDFVVRFEDKTGENRTAEQMDQMVEEMREVANKYDFDLDQYGDWKGIKKTAIGEVFMFLQGELMKKN